MSANIVTSSPLQVLALLPDAIPAPSTTKFSTPRFQGRSSATGIPTLRDLRMEQPAESEDPLFNSRRMSLAPGLGAGVPHAGDHRHHVGSRLGGGLTPLSTSAPPVTESPESSSPTTRESPHRAKPRQPYSQMSPAALAALKAPRGSMALPPGMGLGMGGPGAAALRKRAGGGGEGEQLVDALRRCGLEVTTVRHITQLPSILAPETSIRSLSSPKLGTDPPKQVVLVPLASHPVLPSLSLLLSQGTTPSAVCFQQDVLDRAKRIEDDWLTTAVASIHQVEQQLEKGNPNGTRETKPVIIAYVPTPTSSTAVSACINAGASGVLHAPFTSATAFALNQMVQDAIEGKTSAALSQSPPTSSTMSPMSAAYDDDAKVVLTPTALGLGAEHESEKVLSSAVSSSRRRASQQLGRVTSPGSTISHATLGTPQHERVDPMLATKPTAEEPSLPTLPSNPNIVGSLLAAHHSSDAAARRRSVDTGGIALAFDRANKRMVPADQLGAEDQAPAPPEGRRGSFSVVAGDREQEHAAGNTTQFAEVLGEMYQQTMLSIDIQMSEYKELSAPLSPEERKRLVTMLSTWDFRPHLLSQSDLYRVACLVFEAILHTEGIAELGITTEQVNQWLFAIRSIYHAPNPYHNYVHAIDVLQATYLFLVCIGVAPPFAFFLELTPGKIWRRPADSEVPAKGSGTTRARTILRPQDVLGVLVAAIGHDVGHPGLSNAFMKNARVPLSVVYDDKSVLENMHCMLVVHLLRKHGLGFLIGPATAADAEAYPARAQIDYRSFRRVLYSAILATDMSLHFAWITRLKEFSQVFSGDKPIDRDDKCEEDRIMICQALIKCADISNPTRPIDVSEHWSTVLLDEWTKQASLEQELDLPVSVVAGVDARMQAKGQIGFIDLFTQPLFTATADIIPEMATFSNSCGENRSTWQDRLERLETDDDEHATVTAALQNRVHTPTPMEQDSRYLTLFPLILPPNMLQREPTSPPLDSQAVMGTPPTSPGGSMPSPAARAVRVVYRDEVRDRGAVAAHRHVVAVNGLDAHGSRRMSTPEVLLVRKKRVTAEVP